MANGAQNASGTPAPAASHSGGHVVSARATTIGLMAILLWSFMAGTVRIVSENFGATLGSALIYTVGGILLLMFRRPAPIREFPKKYLIIGGIAGRCWTLFVCVSHIHQHIPCFRLKLGQACAPLIQRRHWP